MYYNGQISTFKKTDEGGDEKLLIKKQWPNRPLKLAQIVSRQYFKATGYTLRV